MSHSTVESQSQSQSHAPPAHPPPYLSSEQLNFLAYQGYLPLPLSEDLATRFILLFDAATDFFAQDESVKTAQYPATHGTELGYYHVQDEKQYLTLRYSDQNTELETRAREAWMHTAALLHRILCDIARVLDLDEARTWRNVLDGCLAMPTTFERGLPSLLRLFAYEPEGGTAGRHKDNGLLTLCVGDGRGLQVRHRHFQSTGPSNGSNPAGAPSGEWIDAEGPTLLVGSVLRVLSANRFEAGEHRVVGTPAGRSSIVLALRPSLRHNLDLEAFGIKGLGLEAQLGEPVTMQALWDHITSGKVNVNEHKHIRERKQAERQKRLAAASVAASAATETQAEKPTEKFGFG